MTAIYSMPVFGVLITLLAFEAGLLINKKTKKFILNPLLNPLLIAIALVILILKILPVSLEDFNEGGRIISFLLAPATVALAVPLYKNFALLKKNALPILAGIFTGSLVSVTSVLLLSMAFGLDRVLGLSLTPKSVTTPIGIEISKQLGGIGEITVAAIIATGITGVIIGPSLFRILKIKDPVAIGVAMGTSAHALGTAKAIELGEVEGAMSALAIGVAGLITVLIAPIVVGLLL